MDIPRPEAAKQRRRRRIIYAAVTLAVITLVTVGLSRLQPALPLVENPYTDVVKRGPMLREVRGSGTLVPEEIRWVPAVNAGRVERILVEVGAQVKADTILLELSNPDAEQAMLDAQWQLNAAEAETANLKVQLETARLTQLAATATAEANYDRARMDANVNAVLAKDGLVPDITLKASLSTADELDKLRQIEQERLKMIPDSKQAQLASQEAKVQQFRGQYELRKQQVEALKVRAGIDGVLQRLGDTSLLQKGQQIVAGANLARVANPKRLKAQVKIAETQIKDVEIGQPAAIDTRNGIVMGKVVRIDPAAESGTFTVDVTLEGALPKGARPDLNVDGTIQLEKLTDVLFVGRPVNGQGESTVGLYKVVENGHEAVRIPVKLGRSSVTYIEIVDGLQAGDKVILSDMSAWDAHARVRVN